MRKLIMKLNRVSLNKFIILVLFYFLLLFVLEYVDHDGQTIVEGIIKIANQTEIEDQVLYDRAQLFIFWYYPIKNYALYVFGAGIVLNIVTNIVINKTKNKPFIIILGILKFLTLAFITGFLSIIYGLILNKNAKLEDKEEKLSERLEQRNTKSKESHNYKPKNYHHKVYRFSTASLITAAIFYGIALAVFIFMTTDGGMDLSQFVKEMGVFELFLILIGTYVLFGYGNKSSCFIKSYKKARQGMCVDEVKNIMRKYEVTDSGYNRNDEYILEYKISSGRAFEAVRFIFFNDSMITYETSYRRITTSSV